MTKTLTTVLACEAKHQRWPKRFYFRNSFVFDLYYLTLFNIICSVLIYLRLMSHLYRGTNYVTSVGGLRPFLGPPKGGPKRGPKRVQKGPKKAQKGGRLPLFDPF